MKEAGIGGGDGGGEERGGGGGQDVTFDIAPTLLDRLGEKNGLLVRKMLGSKKAGGNANNSNKKSRRQFSNIC